MGILSKLLVSLGLDARDYKKGLAGADSETGSKIASIGGKLQGLGSKMTGLGTKATAGLTAPIVAAGLASMDAASDLEESMSKVNVVFGDSAGAVVDFSDTAAEALGQSQQQALEAAGTFGNLFVSMQMAPDVAADMSTGLVTLGSDLASFNNAMPNEALDALRAGLTGETEPLKRFGVNINAAAIATKALELGLGEVVVDQTKVNGLMIDNEKAQQRAADAVHEYGMESLEAREAVQKAAETNAALQEALAGEVQELTSAEKAQAVYSLIMDQTATAQGDFARTSDGLANSTRIAKAQIADAAATMGQHLLPIGLKVVGFVNDLVSKFANLDPKTQKIILVVGGLAAAIGPLLIVVGSLIGGLGSILGILGPIGAALGTVAGVLSGPVLAVIAAVVAAVALLKLAWDNNFLGIRDTLINLWENTIKPALSALWDWLQVNIPLAIETLRGFWDNVLLPAIQRAWTWIKTNLFPLFETLWRLLKVTLGKALEFLGALWDNVLLPAIKRAWEFVNDKLIPIFKAVADVVSDRLGPVLSWLKDNIIDPVAGAFRNIGGAISEIIGWIENLINKIQGIELPSWLQPGSPTPFEIGLWGINRALKAVARSGMPELEIAIQGVSRSGLPAGGGAGDLFGSGPGAGDHYEIHNHGAPAAALTMARLDERRRARLNLTMG